MVFRRRSRGSSIRPVQRIKHVIDNQFAATAGTETGVNLAIASDNPALANRTECQTGSTINGIYIHCEAYATNDGALSNAYMMISKNPGGNLTLPVPNAVGASDNKRYVIHQEMVMLQKNQEVGAAELGGNPRTLFNGVVVIPKGYRRMGPNDIIRLQVLTPGVTSEWCMQAHYKEFR